MLFRASKLEKFILVLTVFFLLTVFTAFSQDIVEPLEFDEITNFGSHLSEQNSEYEQILINSDQSRIAVRVGSTIEIWELPTFEKISEIVDPLSTFAWSPDGTRLATSAFDTLLSIWDSSDGSLIEEHEGIEAKSNGVRSIEWYKVNQITTGSFEYLLWNTASNDLPEIIDCHPWGSRLSWSHNQHYVATMGDESSIIWICDNDFRVIAKIEGYTSLAWSPDDTEIATVGIQNTLRIWNVESGEAISTSVGGDNNIVDIEWNVDGDKIVTVHTNDELRVWQRMMPDSFWLVGTMIVPGLNDAIWYGNRLITSANKTMQLWELK
ncbi:hypothetical protein G4Y79_22710 [Phototrophicus methaneseepsis]|uniref:Translation initiation factor beta propellor-like domain-containing protein n=1 Tax=Phototrophicus methaneseepsis TaxID=2710758 RepID=A0A7S8E8Y0_9CHLR|nr:hypothetical protein [Phototrophicus methaneseepsis]QPC82463.1 hypothetical protein G4Y79_22710 [Phototrophicus methaneseepsis]